MSNLDTITPISIFEIDGIEVPLVGGVEKELESFILPETFKTATNIYYFDVGDDVLLSCDIADTGLYKYSKTDKITSLAYNGGSQWSSFQMVGDNCLISSNSSKTTGILFYNKTLKTVTMLYDTGYSFKYMGVFEDYNCLISSSSYGILLFNNSTKTITQISTYNYYTNGIKVNEDCLLGSQNANATGVLLYQNSTKSITKIYSSLYGWTNFAVVNNNCIVGSMNSSGSGQGFLLYKGETKTISKIGGGTDYSWNKLSVYGNYVAISNARSTAAGIYIYNDISKTATKVYENGYNWYIFKGFSSKLLLTSENTGGIVSYDIETSTASLIYLSITNCDIVVSLENEDCLISKSGSSVGILYFNSLENTIEQLYTSGTWSNFHKINNDYLISSNGTGSSNYGILYFNNAEKTINRLYSSGGGWTLFVTVGENCLMCSSGTNGVLIFNNSQKTITQLYKLGRYDTFEEKTDFVKLFNSNKSVGQYIFEYNIPNQEIQSVKILME